MKKKLLILGLLAVAIMMVLFLLISSSRKTDPQVEEVTLELPPPVIDNMVEEKLTAYQEYDRHNSRRSYEEYYQALPILDVDTTTPARTQIAETALLKEHETVDSPSSSTSRGRVVMHSNSIKADVVKEEPSTVTAQIPSHSGFITVPRTNKKASQYTSEEIQKTEVRISVISDTKVTHSGQSVTLRLLESITINGYNIPQNTRIIASAQLGDRIHLHLSSIRWKNSIIPVTAQIFDMDGMEGINIPHQKENIVEDVSQDLTTSLMSAVTARVSSIAASAIQSLGAASSTTEYIIPAGYELILRTKNE